MHPIIDTAMLKHHRIDYRAKIDKDGAGRPRTIRPVIVVLISVLALAAINLGTGLAA